MGLNGVGSGASGRAAEGAPVPDVWEPLPTRQPPPTLWRPAYRRAHLTFVQADDTWRTWGEKNLEKLNENLREDPKSRQRMDAFIRGYLQHGRFEDARKKAEEFVGMDPDYANARELLAYAAVVDGDHETARKMLDVRTEANPRDPAAHAQSARSFEVVGDEVRACAHYRALAEIAPNLEEATSRAQICWQAILSGKEPSASSTEEGEPGQLQIEVRCDAGVSDAECPSPVAIAPDGRVLSPWTPGTGKSSRHQITFVKLRSGDYHILVLGGAPDAKGKLVLTGRHENKAFLFQGGGMHTIAKTTVAFW
jgi:tetratricopeptide (TPR) repeat protein